MSTSTTIVAALIYKGGLVIAADSQATDELAGVRWPFEKLDRIQNHPLVIGFSGSTGMSESARSALEEVTLHPNKFKKRDRIRDTLDRCLDPVYQTIQHKLSEREQLRQRSHIWDITLWGLAACWAENAPQILEFEPNGVVSYHSYFHAIGSGANTAYAIWRTLGGIELAVLNWPKSLHVMLRIIRTCVSVEMFGVSEPFSVWVVSDGKARELLTDEIQAEMQWVDEWEMQERKRFSGTE